MSNLDEAMLKHIDHLVLTEGLEFTFRDFLSFEVDGVWYHMKHGTFRNKVCKLKKSGIVRLVYHDAMAFYSLVGTKDVKRMTINRRGVHEDLFCNMIRDLPFDQQSIHDIRLKFKVPNLWNFLAHKRNFRKNPISKDIKIEIWNDGDAFVRLMVHKTNVVSVIVSCSLRPIRLDPEGIIHFFNVMVRAEEKLRNLLRNLKYRELQAGECIPPYRSWMVTMWHFGRDAFTEYSGEKFSITLEVAERNLVRMYSKDFGNKMKVRIEQQEYPKKSLERAITERIYRLDY